MAKSESDAAAPYKLFGVRHHGPGTARSLLAALEAYAPDCILLEGPPEANTVLNLLDYQDQLTLPVALLVYPQANPTQGVMYPFAVFSPEWQAMVYAHSHKVPLSMFDSSPFVRQPEEAPAESEAIQSAEADTDIEVELVQDEGDPINLLAQAAGYQEFEPWWNQLIEEQGQAAFHAMHQAMSAVRSNDQGAFTEPTEREEQIREAHMRHNLRTALKSHQRVAVVCGAWHTPALEKDVLKALDKSDKALLKTLPKVKSEATWIPWTYDRLARRSGYGAGITSPGWYQHLWDYHGNPELVPAWMTHIAQLLRSEGLSASPAQTIDAVMLAGQLAHLRDRQAVSLEDLDQAAEATFAFGNPKVLELIEQQLNVGRRMGSVPMVDALPTAPLQKDFAQQLKQFRIKQAEHRTLELDLRKDNDLQKSYFFHRLELIGMSWIAQGYASGKGSFKESWNLTWTPEQDMILVEASQYGATIAEAASRKSIDTTSSAELEVLVSTLNKVLLANLGLPVPHLLNAISERSAMCTDTTELMSAMLPLLNIARYNDVRQTDTSTVNLLLESMHERVCIGLPSACTQLQNDAAQQLMAKIGHLDYALQTHEALLPAWNQALIKVTQHYGAHPSLVGKASRIVLDRSCIDQQQALQGFSLSASDPDTEKAALWMDGFLQNSGAILVHDDNLFGLIDQWLVALPQDTFVAVLPLLRRTFSTFEPGERSNIAEKVLGNVGGQYQVELNPALQARAVEIFTKLFTHSG